MAAHCLSVPARLVTRQEVELVHEEFHWDRIEWAVSQEVSALKAFADGHESLYLNHASMGAARLAAGAVLELTGHVASGAPDAVSATRAAGGTSCPFDIFYALVEARRRDRLLLCVPVRSPP